MRQSGWSWAVSLATAFISASLVASEVHDVAVGLNHDFQPATIEAVPGDIIHFTFYPQNHSVVRAEYLNPCIPYDYVHPGEPTFFSGNMESEEGQARLTWNLTVNNTDPTYFYCSAPGSCIDYKMVGVINPDKNHTLQTQLDKVDDLFYQLSPGEVAPDENPSDNGGGDDSSNDSPITGGDGGNSNNGGNSHGTHLSGGAIAGIAIGAAAVLLIAIGLVYFCGRKGGIEKGYRRSGIRHSTATQQPPMVEYNYAESNAGTAGPDNAAYYNPSKSPAPTSPYPVPSHASTIRSSSPANWSSTMGSPHMDPSALHSPHHSYSGHASPGFVPQSGFAAASELSATPYDPHFPQEIPETQPPAELPDNSNHRHSQY